MNLSWIDWAMMAIAVVSIRLVSLSTRKHMKGVADFLAANRCAGRYLLTIASAMGGIGVVSVVAIYEVLNTAGTAPQWWAGMMIPIGIIMVLTGWVYYRFRETRALTLAQFFEMRYSRKFRINAGILCWVSGVLNFGIFPGVAARFFIHYCGLPEYFHVPGLPDVVNLPFALPLIGDQIHLFSTFFWVMLVDLVLALSFVLMGGQISVMVTECVQGIFCTIAFMVIIACVMIHFSYSDMMHALQMGSEAGKSTINPFHTGKVTDFNVWYYLIGIFGSLYSQLSWQGSAGFNCSARTPHEQKMGLIIGGWRGLPQGLAIALLGLAAIAVLRLPEYAHMAATINASLDQIPNEYIKGQMLLPVAMAHFLPIGIKGLFATVMLFISFTCHDTYMHSWGSIFVQDVYIPFKKKVLSPAEHIKLLRWSVLFVAFFSFVFSLWYKPTGPIYMFFATTGTIWLGGSGAVIIGGLYWRRGNTAAAYAALNCGGLLGLFGLWLPTLWKNHYGTECPINGQYLWFIGMLLALAIYASVSLITGKGKEPFNITRMLHRGEHADDKSHIVDEFKGSAWMKLVGITADFSKGDRFLAVFLVVWNLLNFLWFVVFSIVNLLFPVTDQAWMTYNWVQVLITLILSIPCAIWFTVGGVMDIRGLFRHLDSCVRDDTDDGRVCVEEPMTRY